MVITLTLRSQLIYIKYILEVLDLNKLQSICRVIFLPCRLLCSENDMKLKINIKIAFFTYGIFLVLPVILKTL